MTERTSIGKGTFLFWYFKKIIIRGFKLYLNEREMILALMIQIDIYANTRNSVFSTQFLYKRYEDSISSLKN